jgi:DNA-3-methyladenine glycosylase II
MPQFLHTDADLEKALRALVKADPRLADVQRQAGTPTLRRREAGFPGLAAIICGQQLSTASAEAIRTRLFAAFERARAARLARLGLSAPKIRYIKAIATEIAKGRLDLDAIAQSDADTAHQALVAVHGIGPWSADIYLLFCLGHADAWPAGDLALQEAARIAFRLNQRPTAKELTLIAEQWRPWGGGWAQQVWTF